MRVERVYDWSVGDQLVERDPRSLDPGIQLTDSVRVGHLSDTHLGKGQPGARRREMRRWVEAFDGLDADVLVHSGDLVEDPVDGEQIDQAFSVLESTDVPYFGVPGNHDVERPGEPAEVTRRFGEYPRVETVGDLQIVLADTMVWPPLDERTDKERELGRQNGHYSTGGLGAEQRAELAELLDEDWQGVRIFVAHHHPRQSVPPKPWYEANADLMRPMYDADEVLELLDDHGVNLMVHGHRHQYVPPYRPFDELLILQSDSVTRPTPPQRARIVDVETSGEAMRVWELVRY